MSVDIKSIVEDVYSDFKDLVLITVTNDAPALLTTAGTYLVDQEKSLKDLAEQSLNGSLSWSFVVKRLEEVKTDLVNALISLEQILASDVQALVNRLITMFEDKLKAVVLTIIGI